MHQLRRLLLPALLLPLFTWAIAYGQECQPTDKVLLTGSPKGYYFKLGKAIAKVARNKGLKLCVQTTEHNLDNVLALNRGDAAFGIAQSDVFHDAWYGHPKKFEDKQVSNVTVVMPLYEEVVHILLRPHLNIAHLGDLRGRSVGMGLADSGTEYTASHILAAAGLQFDGTTGKGFEAVRTTDPDFCDSVHKLMHGGLDALFKVTVLGSVDVQDALKHGSGSGKPDGECDSAQELRLLPLEHDLAERLVSDGSYHETLIPKDAYEQHESTLAVGVKALLLAGKNADPADVETLASLIRNKHHAIDEALQEIVAEEHQHGHDAGNLPGLSLLNVPIGALSCCVHPQAREYVYHWWRDSWLPELPPIISTVGLIFALLYWKRAALGRAIEKQPNLAFGIAATALMWLVAACTFYHFEWEVNEHYNSLARSMGATFLYLTSLSKYSLLTQDAQSFGQSVKWISVVVLGGFASPLLKQGMDYGIKRLAKGLQGSEGGDEPVAKMHVVKLEEEESGEGKERLGEGEMAEASMAPGAD